MVTFLPLSNRPKQWLVANIVLCWSRTSETLQFNLLYGTTGRNTTQLLEVIIISVLLLCLWMILLAFMKGSCAAWLPKDCKLCSGVALCVYVCYNTETVSITDICPVLSRMKPKAEIVYWFVLGFGYPSLHCLRSYLKKLHSEFWTR